MTDIDGSVVAYTVKATGSVASSAGLLIGGVTGISLGGTTDTGKPDNQPMMTFQVDGMGAGAIEVAFHVWWDQDGDDAVAGAKHTAKWHTAKKSLTVTVVAVK